ncbi:MAG: hypothetical protein AB7G06_03740 [Bdellovibrionales bacterium]
MPAAFPAMNGTMVKEDKTAPNFVYNVPVRFIQLGGYAEQWLRDAHILVRDIGDATQKAAREMGGTQLGIPDIALKHGGSVRVAILTVPGSETQWHKASEAERMDKPDPELKYRKEWAAHSKLLDLKPGDWIMEFPDENEEPSFKTTTKDRDTILSLIYDADAQKSFVRSVANAQRWSQFGPDYDTDVNEAALIAEDMKHRSPWTQNDYALVPVADKDALPLLRVPVTRAFNLNQPDIQWDQFFVPEGGRILDTADALNLIKPACV